ncbi:MAG: hypothetical protein ACTHJT_05550 [Cytophaga sp.]|uniref:hypothetical protein n=1 Tax=Cytophaga sp. TaxID=29535 RepID=UPI003F7DC36A
MAKEIGYGTGMIMMGAIQLMLTYLISKYTPAGKSYAIIRGFIGSAFIILMGIFIIVRYCMF